MNNGYEPRTPRALRNNVYDLAMFKRETKPRTDYRPKRGPKKKEEKPFSFAIIKPAFGKFTYKGETGTWAETLERVKADGHRAYRQGNKGKIIQMVA